MKLAYTVEQPGLIMAIERKALERAAAKDSIDAAAAELHTCLPMHFVYKGGAHVALHMDDSAGSPRLGYVHLAK